ncbi:Oligomycin resistance ATP-dependent permease YOR1 [Ceratobasidium theobromae]|uniref:Oligomycin resistance ATP-dependent permease YOR1 n=1 Tax=Ceratobasidium theobromae TaxID=1582974 RepID=A0A5N5QH32_9AGAM|nr:Oligomycin resistance ATP-dependent permease YOR1 [Ceratobasidium theobromae]
MGKSLFQRFWHPEPVPPNFGGGNTVPDADANIISQFTFWWLGPLLRAGWTRPLESEDLWELDVKRQAAVCGDRVEQLFYERCPPRKRPPHMRTSSPKSAPGKKTEDRDLESAESASGGAATPTEGHPQRADSDNVEDDHSTADEAWVPLRKHPNKWDQSLVRAINRAFFWRFWSAGLFKAVGDVLNATTPVVTRLLLTYLGEAYYYSRGVPGAPKPRAASYGFGLAIAVAVMQEVSSLCTNQYFFRAMTTGFLIRTSVISTIFRKSLRLSGRSRTKHSTGQITTMISADCTRLDFASGFFHVIWTGPIEIIIGIALLIHNLGYSALVGLGVLVLGIPAQAVIVRRMILARRATVQITDKRVRLLQEILQGIRLLVLFGWQGHYGERVLGFRRRELIRIRKIALYRATIISTVTFIPILAATLSFITYALTGHDLNAAVIFSSLQLFNIIRMPLVFVPLVASSCGDAYVALGRISKFLTSEELEDEFEVQPESKSAVDIRGTFTWERGGSPQDGQPKPKGKKAAAAAKAAAAEAPKPTKEDAAKKKAEEKNKKTKETEKKQREKKRMTLKKKGIDPNDSSDEEENGPEPFRLVDVDLQIPRGSFVGIAGKIGSGKSSLLQAMTGEMRRTAGNVILGGTTAYAPQQAWIQNLTLRENVTFGRPDMQDRFSQVVQACALKPDIEMLHDGEQTEIGERGVNLSGGQKARINLARVAYFGPDIALLDDPLSAVDSHVSKHILENCLLSGPLADKTRILVTHQLHVLPYVDEVIFMDNGRIIERGTYNDLVAAGGQFSQLVAEYGVAEETNVKGGSGDNTATANDDRAKSNDAPAAKLMQGDERTTGAVGWEAYTTYIGAAGGLFWVPILAALLTLAQASNVMSNLFLGFWTSNQWNVSQGAYMGIYAALGFATAIFSFMGSFAFAWAGFTASLNLFTGALGGVLGSPMKFFDTTPIGAIIARLSKDIDTLDANLPQAWFQLLSNAFSILGTIALVFYTYAWLGIMFPPLFFLYWYFSMFYRRTSIEVKRLDSILRSLLYAAFSEALTGLTTIRAYREQPRFIGVSERKIDVENKAYFMTIACQRYLGVRLDFLGNLLILGIGLIAVGFRDSADPSKLGVVLTYALTITQTFSQMVTQLAQVEQDMNTVERIVHYRNLEQEPPANLPDDPPAEWPQRGSINFRNVALRYRDGLPLVLDGLTFDVKPGERVGIVGRTGAGKTSLLTALFRVAPLAGGTIEIDGINIEKVGIETLRHRLSIIPQDAVLFEGTLRENIDPLKTKTDEQLYLALRKVQLLGPGSGPPPKDSKLHLDNEVRDDSFSAGERQLLALCRALIKDQCKVLILDEATSSVDVDTDAMVQQMIQRDFYGRTLLCIAHRLNTIAFYDRVLVMDRGRMKEYDTPLNLFDNPDSQFRAMCDKAGLSRADIVKIRAGAEAQLQDILSASTP